jgi:hypothetical protein
MEHILQICRHRRVLPLQNSSNDSTYYMEERLEYVIIWSINPFVHNPYHKHHHHHSSGTSTPGTPRDPDSPSGAAMITLQQMQGGVQANQTGSRRGSVDPHALSLFEQLGTPKASYAELFYDLFFVASLTSFGIKHEITQAQAIASYVAFFTVLWYFLIRLSDNRWVWTSQMLYDVRFETGDVIHRIFKFGQLILLGMTYSFLVDS